MSLIKLRNQRKRILIYLDP